MNSPNYSFEPFLLYKHVLVYSQPQLYTLLESFKIQLSIHQGIWPLSPLTLSTAAQVLARC